ncbi:MrcB family domain-containing protein [Methanobacterium alcaliphilum]|uniref:MrcB family domain-containing protein n=1 Tax=Methanobacterium alcaliphilum TaxID=392018 RepID=UPI00200AA2EF|nr:DUF3578 domain-containing protein [Methanobacterium alcaliphilum]MCK9151815.1 DUF3578 domain-containing protein [Methanobacterium alcaliphilum]
MLRDYIQRIFNNYQRAKTSNFTGSPIVKLITEDFPEYLKEINLDSDDYIFKGNAGKGNWTECPYIAILNSKITTGVGSGYYVIYIFSNDTKSLYLSLNQEILKSNSVTTQDYLKDLSLKASEFRKKIGDIPDKFNLETLSLGNPTFYSRYEIGNICAKEYTIEDLPSEEELEADLKEILKIYEKLANSNNEKHDIRDFIKNMLENYLKAKNNEKLAKELVSYANGGEFHQYWIKIANRFEKGDYATFGLFGAAKTLQRIPYIHIFNKKYPTWRIIFLFREDMKGVYLSLGQHPWTMDGRLKEKGLNIQKFSEEFNNYLLNDASEARTKLKNLTTIPDEYLEKIDLGSENAISAASREAGNVFAKYYTLENLPSENELISDFKEILNLYKKLGDETNISENINIKEPLEFIFKNLPKAKKQNENPKNHEVHRAFLDIKDAIFEIAKSIHPEKNYNSQAYYQDKGNWFKSPYVYLENKAHKDIFDHRDQHFVVFWFNEDLKGVILCLSQSAKYAKKFLRIRGKKDSKKEIHSYMQNHDNYVKNELKYLNIKEDLFLDSEIDNVSDRMIYGKYYDKNNLPSNDEIIADFKDLFYLYSKLKPDHGKYANADFKIIENKNQIKESQNKLESIFKLSSQKNDNIHFSSDLGIWMSSGKNPDSFYNLFGIENPYPTASNETIIEINFPFNGINRKISGAFVKDDSGNVFLVHRGNLGGKYAGKSLLEENYDGEWVDVDDGRILKKFILIGDLDNPDFPEKLKNFVYDICKIKKGTDCMVNQNFFNYLHEKGYLFDQKLVENFLLSLKVKPFVILTGNSGTGKTKVAQLFAKYLNLQSGPINPRGEKSVIFPKRVDITSNSKKVMGNWELKPDELNKLKDFTENLTLEVHQGRTRSTKSGKGYVENNRLFYAENTPFFEEINKIIGGSRTEIQVIAQEYQENLPHIKHEIVPVGANWTENRHVVGFYNVITGNYQKTQALNLILNAKQENENLVELSDPYFLILDEMNLSHVERYFSDFLSVMESQEEMPLHDNSSEEVPAKLKLPKNLLVIGTVNVDETTYMFSPKVLDRANTIEFLTLNPLKFMKNQSKSPEPSGDIEYLENPLSDLKSRNSSIDELQELMKNIKTKDNQTLWDVISREINNIYNELKKAGFDFGFRVVNEIIRFMYVAWKYEGKLDKWENWERYFDAQIKQKMLPKLHGSQRTMQEPIKSLFKICYGESTDLDPRIFNSEQLAQAKYPTAALKLSEMDKVLYEQRYVAFIN